MNTATSASAPPHHLQNFLSSEMLSQTISMQLQQQPLLLLLAVLLWEQTSWWWIEVRGMWGWGRRVRGIIWILLGQVHRLDFMIVVQTVQSLTGSGILVRKGFLE